MRLYYIILHKYNIISLYYINNEFRYNNNVAFSDICILVM